MNEVLMEGKQYVLSSRTVKSAVRASLFGFGVAYAAHIAVKPMRYTWLSVVVGDAMTDIGSSVMLFLSVDEIAPDLSLRRKLGIASIPFVSHIITGIPMILGQIFKRQLLEAVFSREFEEGE